MSGGTLKILGTSLTSLNANRPTTFTAASAVGFNIDDAANTFTVSQVLNQTSGGLTKTGSGTLLLSGTNTYTGVTTASGGTLRLSGGSSIVDTGTVAIAGGSVHFETSKTIGRLNVTGSGAVTAAPGATLTSGTYAVSNPVGTLVTLSANLAGTNGMTISGTGDVALAGNNSFAGGLRISGPATVTLSGSNSYTGDTDWSSTAGSVVIVGDNNAFSSGTVALRGNTSSSSTLRASANVTLGNTFLTTVTNRTLVIDGSNSITFSAPFINASNNILRNDLSAGSLLTFGQLTVFSGSGATGGLTLSGSGNTTIARVTPVPDGVAQSSASFQISNSGTTTITGTLAINRNIAPALTLSGGGRLVIGPAAVMLSAGTSSFVVPIIGSNGSTFEYASNLDSTLTGAISGTLSILKTGSGTLRLDGTNTFTGNTLVSSGTLMLGSNLALQRSGLDTSGAGVLATSGTAISSPTLGGLIGSTDLASVITTGYDSVSSLTLNPQDGETYTYSGVIANGTSAGMSLTKTGLGVQVLAAANTYSGDTLVQTGTLSIGNDLALQNSGFNTSGAGRLNATGRSAPTFGGLLGSTDLATSVSAGYSEIASLTLNPQSGKSYSYGGVIANGTSAGMSLTKSGPGTQELSGVNTYTGATSITGGLLAIASTGDINSTSGIAVAAGSRFNYNGTTPLTVAPVLAGVDGTTRAVLGGSGTINAAVDLNTIGDVLAPGNSPGILGFGTSQTWASFTYDWETNDFTGTTAGSAFDQIAITGGLDLTGGAASYLLNVISLTSGNLPGNLPNFDDSSRQWTILTTTAGITGFNASNWTINTSGFTAATPPTGAWNVKKLGNDIVLEYVIVPEPGTIALSVIGIGLTGFAAWRRRRR